MKHPIANKKLLDSMKFLEKAATPSDPLSEGDKAELLSLIELAFNQVLTRYKLGLNAGELFNFNKADNNINLAFKYESHKAQSKLVMYNVTLDCIQSNRAVFALYGILDALSSNGDYSKFEDLKVKDFDFILGDGDDWGAVTINGRTGKEWYDTPKSITFWVRHFG